MLFNKKDMKKYLKDLADHHNQPSFGEGALYEVVKQNVCKRMQEMLQDIGKVISFAIDSSNFGDFDDLLHI